MACPVPVAYPLRMWSRVLLIAALLLAARLSPLGALEQRLSGSQVLVGKHYEMESDAEVADAQAALHHLDRFHAHLTEVFAGVGKPWDDREVVRYCGDRESFLAYGRKHCPGFSEGWYGYQAAATATAPAELVAMHLGSSRAVLQHEAFHLFMARAYPQIRSWPRWFDEGLADCIGRGRFVDGKFTLPEHVHAGDLQLMRDALSNETFVPLERLFRLDNAAWNGRGQLLHYAEAYLLVTWLMRSDEAPYRGLMRSFLLRLATEQRYEPAFAATFGTVGVTRLQREWVEWLRAVR